jgi:hypothetical protein
MEQEELVDPRARRFQRRSLAPPRVLAGQAVVLIDSMLNPAAGWGQALLAGAQAALAPLGARFQDERRPPLAGSPAAEWAEQIARHAAAAVIAVGD